MIFSLLQSVLQIPKHIFPICVIIGIVALSSLAQSQGLRTYRVFFKNKGPEFFAQGSTLFNRILSQLPQHKIERRRIAGMNPLITFADVPVYTPYVDSIRSLGAKVLLVLQWENYGVIECDESLKTQIERLSFVRKVQTTSSKFTLQSFVNINTEGTDFSTFYLQQSTCGAFSYGPSLQQNQRLNTPQFHAMGFTGEGVIVGVLDNGFRWKNHESMKHLSVLKEYDFIYADSLTANDSTDISSQDNHGTPVLSCLGGYQPDSLIGTAPFAQFLLAKTEDMRYERRIEEDNYAAAIEWLENSGADITTSSLGYAPGMDTSEVPYPFSDLDGSTTITARYVNRATTFGMMCITAAGNQGGVSQTIITPADADSVISVGAYRADSLLAAGFTSKGPNARGVIKPDVSAQGVQVVVCNMNTPANISKANGTSFSTPLFAGVLALLKQAFPDKPGYVLRNALIRSGSQYGEKDNILGAGMPDIMKAASSIDITVSPVITYPALGNTQIFAIHLWSEFPLNRAQLFIRNSMSNDEFTILNLEPNPRVPNQFSIPIRYNAGTSSVEWYLEVSDSVRSRRVPSLSGSVHQLQLRSTSIPCGVALDQLPTSIDGIDDVQTTANYKHYLSFALPQSAIHLSIPSVFTDQSLPTNITVFDALGNSLKNYTIEAGTNLFEISDHYQTGLYFILFQSGTTSITGKLLLY